MTDSLTGILKGEEDVKPAKEERLRENMKLLIDANILLDVLQNRKAFVDASALVWKLCETKKAKGYVSALTFANLVYVMRKELEPEKIEDILQKLSFIFEFTELNASDLDSGGGTSMG